VGVEKLFPAKFAKKIAAGCPTNDFLSFRVLQEHPDKEFTMN
jgi:hypothetical protein